MYRRRRGPPDPDRRCNQRQDSDENSGLASSMREQIESSDDRRGDENQWEQTRRAKMRNERITILKISLTEGCAQGAENKQRAQWENECQRERVDDDSRWTRPKWSSSTAHSRGGRTRDFTRRMFGRARNRLKSDCGGSLSVFRS